MEPRKPDLQIVSGDADRRDDADHRIEPPPHPLDLTEAEQATLDGIPDHEAYPPILRVALVKRGKYVAWLHGVVTGMVQVVGQRPVATSPSLSIQFARAHVPAAPGWVVLDEIRPGSPHGVEGSVNVRLDQIALVALTTE